MTSGRKKTTGRFETRGELVRRVRDFYELTNMSYDKIATNTQVSQATIIAILKKKHYNKQH